MAEAVGEVDSAAAAARWVAGALTEARDRDAVLRVIGRHICRLVAIDHCSVYLRDRDMGLYRGEVEWSRAWERGEDTPSRFRA